MSFDGSVFFLSVLCDDLSCRFLLLDQTGNVPSGTFQWIAEETNTYSLCTEAGLYKETVNYNLFLSAIVT